MSNHSKGDIWMYPDPDSGKRRPGIIVGYSGPNEFDVTIAKLSSQPPRTKFDLVLENWKEIELIKPSIVRTNKLYTINANRLIFKVGKIEGEQLKWITDSVVNYIIGESH
ncbi:type II toxin-antitoxin system PemK/MazF family toxin [Bacillus velezensis]|uniref:type II toxin-antitoxin system PemK/MazF family toxin n=1 Tax=Bacillus velezensis TaxID=492670 RepID=UPI0022E33C46|nr:type II toxin-antitoxin system PemK/MazF family toxin [Bacillus velezensis]